MHHLPGLRTGGVFTPVNCGHVTVTVDALVRKGAPLVEPHGRQIVGTPGARDKGLQDAHPRRAQPALILPGPDWLSRELKRKENRATVAAGGRSCVGGATIYRAMLCDEIVHDFRPGGGSWRLIPPHLPRPPPRQNMHCDTAGCYVGMQAPRSTYGGLRVGGGQDPIGVYPRFTAPWRS